jgi:hypothetical protein
VLFDNSLSVGITIAEQISALSPNICIILLYILRFKGKADPLLCPPLAKNYHVTVGGIVEPSDPRLPLLSQPFFYHGASHGPDGEWTIPATYRVLYTKQYTEEDDPWPFHFLMQRWVTVIEVNILNFNAAATRDCDAQSCACRCVNYGSFILKALWQMCLLCTATFKTFDHCTKSDSSYACLVKYIMRRS